MAWQLIASASDWESMKQFLNRTYGTEIKDSTPTVEFPFLVDFAPDLAGRLFLSLVRPEDAKRLLGITPPVAAGAAGVGVLPPVPANSPPASPSPPRPSDTHNLEQAIRRLFEVADTQNQMNNYTNAMLLTVAEFMVNTAICKQEQFESSLAINQRRLQEWQAAEGVQRAPVSVEDSRMLDLIMRKCGNPELPQDG